MSLRDDPSGRLPPVSQAKEIAQDLRAAGASVAPDREIVALIAYLQTLGHSENLAPVQAAAR